ncbi:hypothetical protein FACS1894166_11740 [Bacilli bacterium]|nr:hypothetical protein FACS1894166_11740 [Bacilli bacterium]
MFGGNGGNVKFSFGGNGGGFGDIFGDLFGGGQQRQKRQRASQNIYELNIEGNLTISFLDSILGTKHSVKLKTKHDCPHCHGSGAESPSDIKTCPKCRGTGVVTTRQRTILGVMESQEYCPDCQGTGKIIAKPCHVCRGKKYMETEETVELNIDAGISNGQRLIFKGKGNSVGAHTGDLYLTVYVQPSRIFKRKDNTLYAKVLVDPVMAITGGRIKIPTPYGIKEIELKSNTANGEEITVSGFGIKNLKHKMFGGNANGDLVISIVYAKPKKYNKADIEHLREINKEPNKEVDEFYDIISKELNN